MSKATAGIKTTPLLNGLTVDSTSSKLEEVELPPAILLLHNLYEVIKKATGPRLRQTFVCLSGRGPCLFIGELCAL